MFQFTPLREGRQICSILSEGMFVFQFTPLREGRHTRPSLWGIARLFQFTPLREGRLAIAPKSAAAHEVSIHAPA